MHEQFVLRKSTVEPYLVLGLEHDATPKQVRQAYRALMLEEHPDR